MEDEKVIAGKAIQSIDGLVGLLNNPPSQHTSQENRSGPASSTGPYLYLHHQPCFYSHSVKKFVLILDFGTDRALSRGERAIMKQQGKIISEPDLSRDWGENRFIEELLNVFPTDWKEAGFEFVKNCGGGLLSNQTFPIAV